MKIVFDSRWIYEKPSGIGVYAREMMCRIPCLMPDSKFVFLFRTDELRDRLMLGVDACKNVDSLVIPYGPLSLKSQLKMPAVLSRIGADLFHTPNYMIPYWAFSHSPIRRTKCIVNIHDVIPLVVKNYAPNSRTSRFKRIFRFCMKSSISRANCVITGSEASKRDMIASLALDQALSDRIQVVYDGAGGRFDVQEHDPIKTDETTPRTLLYVGRMDPYKNVAGLVEALALAQKRVAFPLRLIVCGPADDRYPEAQKMAQKLGIADAVRFTGFVSDEELADLYRTSDLLTHPSRYEGFGLQLVEAMRSGLPVCCTDGGSQPEIAGDAACIVKAGDSLSMAGAIAEVLSSADTMQQMKLSGLAHAALFDWEICAMKTVAIYRSLVPTKSNRSRVIDAK